MAPYISGGAGELTGVINALYGDELQLEQDRLAAAFPRVRTRESSLAAAEASMHASTPIATRTANSLHASASVMYRSDRRSTAVAAASTSRCYDQPMVGRVMAWRRLIRC